MITNKNLLDIYNTVFCELSKQYITVFLCGGAYNKNNPSLRDRIKPLLERGTRLNYRIRVFYPEELMIDILNRDRKKDLLSCEGILADNSDVIVIICESAGSLVELGAFVNNPDTSGKTIVGIAEKRKKDKSFIMLGPVRYLENKGKGRVFYYKNNEIDDVKEIVKCLRNNDDIKLNTRIMQLNTIVGIHFYIQFLLYFFNQISLYEIKNSIKDLSKLLCINEENLDILIKASINLLYKERIICKVENEKAMYELTSIGRKHTIDLISSSKLRKNCDRIRMSIIYDKYYKAPQS